MAWIECHQSIWLHKKTFKLAAALGIDAMMAAAYVLRLNCWAIDNTSDGRLTDVPDDLIAEGAGWKKDPHIFVSALADTGWLDRIEGGYALHDWDEYGGKLIESRKQDAERKRRERERKKGERPLDVRRTSDGNPADVQRRVHYSTQDNSTGIILFPPSGESEQKRPIPKPSKATTYTPEFEEFWSEYPEARRLGKKGAFEKWNARLREGIEPEVMIQAARYYCAWIKKRRAEPRYIKHPETFLGHNLPFEDFKNGMPREGRNQVDERKLKIYDEIVRKNMTPEERESWNYGW